LTEWRSWCYLYAQSKNSIGVLLPRMAKSHAIVRDGEAGASPALTRNGKRAACVRLASPVDRPD